MLMLGISVMGTEYTICGALDHGVMAGVRTTFYGIFKWTLRITVAVQFVANAAWAVTLVFSLKSEGISQVQ